MSFDDDNYQPPTRNFGYAPPRGPQFDSPSGPPVRATVKWYNPDKGFGFVELADGSGDAFLHVSVVERSGARQRAARRDARGPCRPGPEGTAGDGDPQRGRQHRVARAAEAPRPERPAYPPSADRPTVEELGTVKWYNATKGFGFIAADRGGKDIFVHASALERAGIMGLAEGQRVAVDVADGQKGPEAVSLRLV